MEPFKGKIINFAPHSGFYNLYVTMTYIERLQNEKANLYGHIFMYEDGSKFVRALERSAYMFCQVFKPFTTVTSNNKEYGAYVYIGFNKEQLERFTSHPDYVYDKKVDGTVTIHTLTRKTPMDFPEEEYIRWKDKALAAKDKKPQKEASSVPENVHARQDEHPQESTPASAETTADAATSLIIADIMSQQLSNYTPMQALNYLNSLQERIRHERIPY